MKIVFVDNLNEGKIGLKILSSILKENGYEVDGFLLPYENNIVKSILKVKPNVICFGSYLGQEADVIELFSEIKNKNKEIITIQGGPSTLFYTDLIYHHSLDFILKGEAEETLLQLLNAIKDKLSFSNIDGLIWKEQGNVFKNPVLPLISAENKEQYPLPDNDLFMKYDKVRNNNTKSFISSRGCPFKCTFCGSVAISNLYRKNKKNHFRLGKASRVIREINYVKKTYGLKWVQFHDATFNANKIQAKEFLREYIDYNMPPFICNIRTETIDEELVELLAQAKCDRVTIGIQTGSERIRKEITGRSKQTDEQIIEVVNLFHKYNIRVHIDLIFGWPGETIEDALETIYLARKLNVYKTSTNVMIYFPDSEITKYAYENGYLESIPDVLDLDSLYNPFYSPLLKTPDIKKLINMDKLCTLFIKYNWLTNKFIFNILINMPPNRFYLFLKNLPGTLVAMKYDSNSIYGKLKIFLSYIKGVYYSNKNLELTAIRVAKLKESMKNE